MEGLVVKSKIKEIAGDFNVGTDFIIAINVKVEELIKESMKRAEANGRKTIMAKDI